MESLKELKERIENIEITWDYETTYSELYNACIDYMNDTQTGDFECIFDEIYFYDTVEEIAKEEIEQGGLQRIYYFLNNADLNQDIFRINAYGNLENISKDDLEEIKEEILETIDNLMENE